MATHFFSRILVICTLFLMVSISYADSDKLSWLNEQYTMLVNDPVKFQQAYKAGRERSAFCSYCHGSDGNSIKAEVPNLAQQNPIYLWKQMENFATGKRKNFVMQALTKKFTDSDKLNLAIFFANNQLGKQAVNSAMAKSGKSLYNSRCINCHGAKGLGNKDIARIAGQKQDYLQLTLNNFRANANSTKLATISTRRSVTMEGVAKKLSDSEIYALTSYVATLSR